MIKKQCKVLVCLDDDLWVMTFQQIPMTSPSDVLTPLEVTRQEVSRNAICAYRFKRINMLS